MGVWEDSCFNSLLKGSNRKFRLILSWILELSLLRNPAVQHSCSHRVWIRSRIRRSVPKVTYWCCYSYNCFPDQHCGLKMASLEILKLFQRVGFSQWVAGAGPRMASTETAELSDRLSEGIHRWTMRPLRGSGVSQLTTAPLVKFVFSWGASLSCVPLIIRAHAPRCPKTRPSVWLCSVECVCVRFMKKKKKKSLLVSFCDLVLPELERIQLGIRLRLTWTDPGWSVFGLASKKTGPNECPAMFYLDKLYHMLQSYSHVPKKITTVRVCWYFQLFGPPISFT